jgi:uncharacterized membrane protein
MNWILLITTATFLDSTRIFIDNYVSDVYFKKRSAVGQKIFYGLTSLITAVIILAITNFSFNEADFGAIGLVLLSGLLSVLSSIPYIKALEVDDSINLGIFIQLAPILYLVFGWFFFGEAFSPIQLIAFAIILSAPLLIIFSTRKKSRHIKFKAILYAFSYVFIAVIGNLVYVKASTGNIDFVHSIAFLLLGRGIGYTVIMSAVPKWRKRFYSVVKSSKFKVLIPMLVNHLIGLAKDFTYRGGLIAAPAVAVASAASDSVEPIMIFFMGIVLTLIWPKFGREKLNRKSVIIHLIAIILVVTGIVLLNML